MTRVIIDTGPIVALLNNRDSHHEWVREVLDGVTPPLYTCEAVISEASFLLGRFAGASHRVLQLITGDVIRLDFSLAEEMEPVTALMQRFSDVPMSLADACLVRMTELESQSVVLTIDRDFRIYRRYGRRVVPTIMP